MVLKTYYNKERRIFLCGYEAVPANHVSSSGRRLYLRLDQSQRTKSVLGVSEGRWGISKEPARQQVIELNALLPSPSLNFVIMRLGRGIML